VASSVLHGADVGIHHDKMRCGLKARASAVTGQQAEVAISRKTRARAEERRKDTPQLKIVITGKIIMLRNPLLQLLHRPVIKTHRRVILGAQL
jgi:hypothetical protein